MKQHFFRVLRNSIIQISAIVCLCIFPWQHNGSSFFLSSALGLSVDRSAFYKDTSGLGCRKDAVADFDAGRSAGDKQNSRFQQAVDAVAACENGGVLNVPGGHYWLRGIQLRSNVHIHIAEDAIFAPASRSLGRGNSIFQIGKNSKEGLENVSIVGKGTGFVFDLTKGGKREAAIDVGHVSNFKLSNFTVRDNETIFASLLFAPSIVKREVNWAQNGIVERARQTGAAVGYGLIQAYAADNILFEEISSEGGVTLRLETDNLRMKKFGKGGVNNIFAVNVSCKNGMAAVMLSPHFMKNGSVTIDDVRAVSCAFAVRTEPGFVEIFGEEGQTRNEVTKMVEDRLGKGSVSTTYARANGKRFAARIKPAFTEAAFSAYKLRPGEFGTVSISNIVSHYGKKGHFKSPQRPFFTCAEQQQLCKPRAKGNVISGGSLAAVYDMARRQTPGGFHVTTRAVKSINYPVENRVLITPNSKRHQCPDVESLPVCR